MLNEFRTIESSPKHRINTSGKVINSKGKELKSYANKQGYLRIVLSCDGVIKSFMIHRLVYTAFVAPIPEGMQINHKDFNKANNDISNLELVTRQQNVDHAVKAGKYSKSDRVYSEGTRKKLRTRLIGTYIVYGKEYDCLRAVSEEWNIVTSTVYKRCKLGTDPNFTFKPFASC